MGLGGILGLVFGLLFGVILLAAAFFTCRFYHPNIYGNVPLWQFVHTMESS